MNVGVSESSLVVTVFLCVPAGQSGRQSAGQSLKKKSQWVTD